MSSDTKWAKLSFNTLISNYVKVQSKVKDMVKSLSNNISSAKPGEFLLLQFAMSQVTQIGESISNLVYQVSAMIMNSVRNQKT